jgi:hypothetical protein
VLTTTKSSPYFIELRGGRYDGFRQPCDAVPFSTLLEMPGPELKLPDAVADWRYFYEHFRTTVAFIEASPVVTFHFRHVGAPRPKRPANWLRSLLETLSTISRRAALPARPPLGRPAMSGRPA